MSTINYFNNFGFLAEQLTENQVRPIKDEIESIKLNFENSIKANKKSFFFLNIIIKNIILYNFRRNHVNITLKKIKS